MYVFYPVDNPLSFVVCYRRPELVEMVAHLHLDCASCKTW